MSRGSGRRDEREFNAVAHRVDPFRANAHAIA
jgi:hypothetical protein